MDVRDQPAAASETGEMDAWTARFARDPVGQVPIDILCLTGQGEGCGDRVPSVVEIVRRKGRLGKIIAVSPDAAGNSWGDAITRALEQASAPLFIISDVQAEWNRDILERLLKAIDLSDLALGARPCGTFASKAVRSLRSMARGVFWGAGVLDPLTPYKLGRTEVFRQFPLQSATRFAEVELVAKANFLDALIHEEVLPVAAPWSLPTYGPGARRDRQELFRHPRFCRRTVTACDESDDESSGESGAESLEDPPCPAVGVSSADLEKQEPHADVRTPRSDG